MTEREFRVPENVLDRSVHGLHVAPWHTTRAMPEWDTRLGFHHWARRLHIPAQQGQFLVEFAQRPAVQSRYGRTREASADVVAGRRRCDRKGVETTAQGLGLISEMPMNEADALVAQKNAVAVAAQGRTGLLRAGDEELAVSQLGFHSAPGIVPEARVLGAREANGPAAAALATTHALKTKVLGDLDRTHGRGRLRSKGSRGKSCPAKSSGLPLWPSPFHAARRQSRMTEMSMRHPVVYHCRTDVPIARMTVGAQTRRLAPGETRGKC